MRERKVAQLKLGRLLDDKPVRLTIELPAQVHRDLMAYAEAIGHEALSSGQVEAAKLVAPMLARFMATDREFGRRRKLAVPPATTDAPGSRSA